MKNKKLIILAVLLIIAILVGAYYYMNNKDDEKSESVNTSTTNQQVEQQAEEKQPEDTKATDIDSAIKAWKAANLTVSDDKGVAFQLVQATNGGKYDVGTTNVELYEYESSDKANTAKQSSFFSDPADTVFVTGKLLVVIHSDDSTIVEPIKSVF